MADPKVYEFSKQFEGAATTGAAMGVPNDAYKLRIKVVDVGSSKCNIAIQFKSTGGWDVYGTITGTITIQNDEGETAYTENFTIEMPQGNGTWDGIVQSNWIYFKSGDEYKKFKVTHNYKIKVHAYCSSRIDANNDQVTDFTLGNLDTNYEDTMFDDVVTIVPPTLDNLENGNKYNNPHPSSGGVKNGVSANENSIRINWKATSDGGAAITRVSVYKKKSDGDYETNPIKTATSSGFAVNTIQHIDIGSLANGTSYTFKVVLKNEAGNSNEKTITIRTKYQAPTLNFYANGCGYNSISCRIYTRTERGTGNGFPIDHAELSIYTRQDQASGSAVDTATFSFTPPTNSQSDFTVTLKCSQEAKALSPGTTYYVYCKIYSTVAYDYVSSDNAYIANDYTHRPYQATTFSIPSGLTVYDKETSGTPIFNKEIEGKCTCYNISTVNVYCYVNNQNNDTYKYKEVALAAGATNIPYGERKFSITPSDISQPRLDLWYRQYPNNTAITNANNLSSYNFIPLTVYSTYINDYGTEKTAQTINTTLQLTGIHETAWFVDTQENAALRQRHRCRVWIRSVSGESKVHNAVMWTNPKTNSGQERHRCDCYIPS